MDYFNYRNNELYAEDVAVHDIIYKYGSPCYIYSRATLERHWKAFDLAFGNQPHLICYAVKANSNIALLNLLARLGSGFDIVSLGE
ncbi:MAG: diaminopimelate decarboxylase, partial [Methylococcaceae bacterium]|nr:diaminopimelate decarboxylase [Methylococcaceae bacterium]